MGVCKDLGERPSRICEVAQNLHVGWFTRGKARESYVPSEA
jgi:hypothetical protein